MATLTPDLCPYHLCIRYVSGKEFFEPFRECLDDVVIDNESGDQEQESEAGLHDSLFDAQAGVPADHALNQQHQNDASVQDRDGEKIEDAKVQADGGHQAEQVPQALAGGV